MTWPVPVGVSPYVWGAILIVLLPAVLIAVAFWGTTGSVFGAESQPMAFILYGLVAVLGLGLLASIKRSDVQVADGKVVLRGSLYNRTVPLSDIDRSSVAVHAEQARPALGMRINGVGLPGYSAGWFRPRGGGRTFVVYGGGPHVSFRTRDGTHHVVGAADAERLRAELALT